jgi:hypothetical protein
MTSPDGADVQFTKLERLALADMVSEVYSDMYHYPQEYDEESVKVFDSAVKKLKALGAL